MLPRWEHGCRYLCKPFLSNINQYIYGIYEIYYISLQHKSNLTSMITATVPSRKKLIDLKDETFKALSVMAVQRGTNLKNFIETILDRVADDYDDALQYQTLSKTDPDGKQPLTPSEQSDFENWLGV